MRAFRDLRLIINDAESLITMIRLQQLEANSDVTARTDG